MSMMRFFVSVGMRIVIVVDSPTACLGGLPVFLFITED